jgi:hypothetical protein
MVTGQDVLFDAVDVRTKTMNDRGDEQELEAENAQAERNFISLEAETPSERALLTNS